MRWCEQYPARERRELWVSTTGGHDIKLIVHGRPMPARRGHQATALLLGERMVGIYNTTTEKQANCLRSDPPLLWRRCDAVAVAGQLLISATALADSAWPALMATLPTAVLYAPLMIAARFVWRCRTRAQVDRVLDIVKRPIAEQPHLRRVKWSHDASVIGHRASGVCRGLIPAACRNVLLDISSIHFGG